MGVLVPQATLLIEAAVRSMLLPYLVLPTGRMVDPAKLHAILC